MLDELAFMPDATFTSGGLVEPTVTVESELHVAATVEWFCEPYG